jgi:hypothetical protein
VTKSKHVIGEVCPKVMCDGSVWFDVRDKRDGQTLVGLLEGLNGFPVHVTVTYMGSGEKRERCPSLHPTMYFRCTRWSGHQNDDHTYGEVKW